MNRIVVAILGMACVSGCSAIKVAPGAQGVELSNAKPAASCSYLGEAIGSQGNWFTGDYTSNKNLMEGARNELRNKAAAMGGNYVWIQNVSNAQAHGALGTSNTTTVGNVYRCGNGQVVTPAYGTTTSPTPTVAGRQSITTPEAGVISDESNIAPRQVSDVQQVLAAQKVAESQGCSELKAHANGDFAASCGSYALIISCEGATCRPVRTTSQQ